MPTQLSLLLLLVSLTACSLWPVTKPVTPLLSPASAERHWQLNQKVTIYPGLWGQQSANSELPSKAPLSLLAVWTVDANAIQLVGLTTSGQRLMSVDYDGWVFNEHYAAIAQGLIDGRNILLQIQLSEWPLAAINNRLQASAWRMTAQKGQRSLYLNHEKIMDIYYNNTADVAPQIIINHYPKAYHVIIETLERRQLP